MINPILMIGMPGPSELFILLLLCLICFIPIVVIVAVIIVLISKKKATATQQAANLSVAPSQSDVLENEHAGTTSNIANQVQPTDGSIRSN